MESQEVLCNGSILKSGYISSYGNGLIDGENGLLQAVEDEGNGKGNLAQDFLEDFEEYWDDINDRLVVSRMVSDSVIKGMVTAVVEDAAEKISAKELELANMKECLKSCVLDHGKYGSRILPIDGSKVFSSFTFTDPCVSHDEMRKDVSSLRNMAMEQFEKILKEVQGAGGYNSVKRIGSGSEFAGLGGILHDKQCENWMHVADMLDSLKKTVGSVCDKVNDVLVSSEISLQKSLEERDFCEEIKGMVMQSVLRSYQEDIEEKMWEHNAQFTGIQNENWLEKFNAISILGVKLDAILKSLSLHETGLVSHGSHDLDHLHQRPFGNHVAPKTTLHGENGVLEEAFTIQSPESYDVQQLKHMTKEELVNYFNERITKMRRDHESVLHQQTDEYFRLKREYLKEKRSFTIHRKDEEFDVLRKKIPEVISKFEGFLSENERFPALSYSTESIGKLKDRLESLLTENRQLRDRLTDKQKELKALETQLSAASEKLLQLSLVEKDIMKLVENLESGVEDSYTEASLSEEVYKCFLRELIRQFRSDSEDSVMTSLMMQETFAIVLREAAIMPETTSKYEVDGSDFDSLILQDITALIYSETIKEFGPKLKEIQIYSEKTAQVKENETRLEVEEKEKLKRQLLDLEKAMEEKDKIRMNLSITLSKEKEQVEVVSQELAHFREYASQQQKLFAEINQESELLRTQLSEAMRQIESNKLEMQELSQKLDEAHEVLAEANKEKDIAVARVREMHDKFLQSKSGGEKLKKEMQMAVSNILGVSEAFDKFECKISEAIKEYSVRLDDMNSQLKALTKMACTFGKAELLYQQRLERKCADLRMAEAEVDLLGDEVDALLRLLEKIYITLDHYLPILKHYPGIVEILELVRRELSGDPIKPS